MHLINLIHQKLYEHIVAKVRRSVATLLPYVFWTILLLLMPVALYFFLNRLYPNLFANEVIYPLAVLFASIYYIFVTMFFYSFFVDFYLNVLVITNDRLVSIKQQGLFGHTIFETDLYQIQNLTSEVHGIFASMFNYGNLTIQTAGVSKLVLTGLPHPDALRRKILDLAAEDLKYHNKN